MGGSTRRFNPGGGIWREAAGRLWKIPHTFHLSYNQTQVQVQRSGSDVTGGFTTPEFLQENDGCAWSWQQQQPPPEYLSTGTGRGLVVVVFKVLRDCIYQIGTEKLKDGAPGWEILNY